MTGRIYVGGELYLSVETVADIYRVERVWLLRALESGLLGDGVEREPTPCIAAVRLDHVATVVRLHHILGPGLDEIRDALDDAAQSQS